MRTYSSIPLNNETSENISCNLCGSRETRFLFTAQEAKFVRCRECGFVFQNPRPVSTDLLKRYDDKYYRYETENEENFFNLAEQALRDIDFENEAKKVSSGVYKKKKKILDIGCATGVLLEWLRDEKDWNVKGVEVCAPAAEYGMMRRGIDIFIGTLRDAQFQDSFFHAVNASHVIEHVPDPKGFLQEIYRILVPGGLVVITTPNVTGLQSRIFGGDWRSAIADHVHLFSKKTLKRFFDVSGFTLLRRKTWGGVAEGAAPPFIKKRVDRWAKLFGFGDVMVYLGRK